MPTCEDRTPGEAGFKIVRMAARKNYKRRDDKCVCLPIIRIYCHFM